jgi:hypothetical protein
MQGPQGDPGELGEQGLQGETGPQGEQGPPIDNASGFARIPRNSRTVVVEPGVDMTFGSVVVVTPFSNLRGVDYWITRDLEADTFTIRLSESRRPATPFSWLIVESDTFEVETTTE